VAAGEQGRAEGGAVSSVEIPDRSLYGLGNLPYGVFSAGGGGPRVGVRVGDSVLDLAATLRDEVFAAPALNPFLAEGPARWAAARTRITELVEAAAVPAAAIHPVAGVDLRLPFEVAGYVDFYASEHHTVTIAGTAPGACGPGIGEVTARILPARP
jgi:fumarylacetoacetase